MAERHHERLRSDEDSPAQAKRRGQSGVDPESQPGEFVDDMRVNRDTPPPAPNSDRDEPSD